MSIFNVFTLLGGLAMFLFGMDVMGKGLEKQAGNKLSKILGKMTASPFKGFLLGLSVTAIIQSSSATTVMVVGFVNSGIMSLRQAIGIIMGSNVGTTVTAWLLSMTGIQGDSFFMQMLKPSSFAPILAFIGIILYMTSRSDKKKNLGAIMLGFAILMAGMETMTGAVSPLSDMPQFTKLFTSFSNPLLGLIAGALLTAVIQSSSASVGILQALSTTGVITYGSAIPIIMGQNIGTCITAILASFGTNKNAKRTAAVHLYFNIIGATTFLIIFYTLNHFLNFAFLSSYINVAGIALVHTAFNVVATAVMLPFSALLEKLAIATIKDDKQEEEFQLLDPLLLNTASVAVERSQMVMNDMEKLSINGFRKAISALQVHDESIYNEVVAMEKTVDKYEDKLGTYLVQLSGQDLSVEDSHEISKMLHIIGDFERISDYSVGVTNVAKEMVDKGISFSADANSEILILKSAMTELLDSTQSAFENSDEELALQVEPLQQVIHELIREVKNRHIER
ncbi:MAG: Na/Pi cotransporter family protein, partial [Oscillospiraceae bacterium]